MSKKMIPQQSTHPYIRVFALLLLTVLALVGISALSWCAGCILDCSCETSTVKRNPYEIRGEAI